MPTSISEEKIRDPRTFKSRQNDDNQIEIISVNSSYWKSKSTGSFKKNIENTPPEIVIVKHEVSVKKTSNNNALTGNPQSSIHTNDNNFDNNNLNTLLNSIPDDDDVSVSESSPSELLISLLPHQLKGLAWMKDREQGIHKVENHYFIIGYHILIILS